MGNSMLLESQFVEIENLAGKAKIEKKRSKKFTIDIYSSIIDKYSYLRFIIKIKSVF